jgi:hypothetical protein
MKVHKTEISEVPEIIQGAAWELNNIIKKEY